jgi:hypothetical protein
MRDLGDRNHPCALHSTPSFHIEQANSCSNALVTYPRFVTMVRFVTLGEDGCEEKIPHGGGGDEAAVPEDDRPNPNFDLKFSAALSCYP